MYKGKGRGKLEDRTGPVWERPNEVEPDCVMSTELRVKMSLLRARSKRALTPRPDNSKSQQSRSIIMTVNFGFI